MRTHTRRVCWSIVSAIVIAAGAASLGAVSDWASGPALGDVAVSFDNQILLLDNAPANPVDTLSEVGVTGYGGMVFDAFLNLVATKTALDGTGELVRFGPLHSHSRLTPNLTTQDSPSALAIAADGTIYVASRSLTSGARAVISRIPPLGSAQQFSIVADTTDCIGIDLDPDQKTLWVVTGGRTVKQVLNANSVTGDDIATTTFTTFTDNGTACGIRLLVPPDIRETPTPPLNLVRLVVADGKEVKFVKAQPGSVNPPIVRFNAGSGNKKWFDVAIDPTVTDPSLADVWAVDKGGRNLARFRLGTGATIFVRDLGVEPRGLAVNGELRAAQTVVPLTLNPTTETPATFYGPNPAARFSWLGKSTEGGTPSFAIQAFEVTHDTATDGPDGDTGLCAPSLNIRCRLVTNFADATPKLISRGRSAVVREILRSTPTENPNRIAIAYRDLTTNLGGDVCKLEVVPNTTALVRDPWEHKVFTDDAGLAVFGGDDTVYTVRKTNDNIVVDRTSPAVKYNLRIVNPTPGTTIQVKRSLPISVEVTNPFANCAAVPGLTGLMILTVTDVTKTPGTPVGDSMGIVGDAPITSNGHPFAFSANMYRTQLYIDPKKFPVNHKFRLCPQIPSNQFVNGAAEEPHDPPVAPLANEACVDINTIK
jgi:hypothetical protein